MLSLNHLIFEYTYHLLVIFLNLNILVTAVLFSFSSGLKFTIMKKHKTNSLESKI